MVDLADFESWLEGWDPPPATTDDPMDPGPTAALAAVLDAPAPASAWLPPFWHWVHFLDWAPTDALGRDGHPTGGDLLPPIPERTRMFVGGRLEIAEGLRTGVTARRHSSVTKRKVKTGGSGTMLFVTVRHEIEQGGKVALVDEQDLMYRSGVAERRRPPPTSSGSAPPAAPWQESFTAGPVLLFRFSALTANSHRIHYDRPYVTGVEGYGDLVVHGPLLAVRLAGAVPRWAPGRRVASVHYRFVRPVLAGEHVTLTGRPGDGGVELAVLAADGAPSATATVIFA